MSDRLASPPADVPPPQARSPWRALRSTEAPLYAIQIAAVLATRVFQRRVYADDAWIHFRNALNWANGDGFLYNAGERLIGTTSPIYAFLLALLHRLTGADLHGIAIVFNAACDIGVALIALMWMRRAGVSILFRHAIALTISLEPLIMYYSAAGMEMSFFTFASMATFELFHRGRWYLAGPLLGVLGWIRPEALVVWIAVPIAMAIARKFGPLVKGYAVALATALAMIALLWARFGAFIPQSLLAKAGAPWFEAVPRDCPREFLIRITNLAPFSFLNGYTPAWGAPSDNVNTIALFIPMLFFIAFGAALLWRAGQRYLAACCALFLAGYYLFYAFANPQIFFWYYAPYSTFILLLAGLGWYFLMTEVRARFRRAAREDRPTSDRWVHAAFAAGFLALTVLGEAGRVAGDPRFSAGTRFAALGFRFRGDRDLSREIQYRRIARHINEWIDGEDRVSTAGCVEIGIFGFHFKGKVLDSYGLVSPEALDVIVPEGATIGEWKIPEHPLYVFLQRRPDFVVSGTPWLPRTTPEFDALYEELRLPRITVRVFVRRDRMPALREKIAATIAAEY